MNDNALIHYNRTREYTITPINMVGATTDTTARTITTPASGTTNYVRKFGNPYLVEDITGDTYGATRSSAGNGWKFEFRGVSTDTLLYTIEDTDGSVTATDGSSVATAEAVKIVLSWVKGTMAVTDGTSIDITTTGNPDAYNSLTVLLPGENLTAGTYDINLYVSDAGSTYYDSEYKHGGYRHTPAVGDDQFTYFSVQDAYTALASRSIAHVLDSELYHQRNGVAQTFSAKTIQSALGETPSLVRAVGASVYREFIHTRQ